MRRQPIRRSMKRCEFLAYSVWSLVIWYERVTYAKHFYQSHNDHQPSPPKFLWPAELAKAKEWHLAATLTWQAIIAWRLDVDYDIMRKEDLPRLASELSQILASYPGPIKKGWRKWTAMKPLAGPEENKEKAAVKTAASVAIQLTEMGVRGELLALVGSMKSFGPGLVEEMEEWLMGLRA